MAKKVIRLTEEQLVKKIKKAVCESLAYKLDYPWPEVQPDIEPLVEMARINMNETGKKSIFPSTSWEIKIWSDDHNPPHFHIKSKGWNVTFIIETGEVLEVLRRGSEKNVYDYMCANVKKWLSAPCAILPQITNQQNATVQWIQIHG